MVATRLWHIVQGVHNLVTTLHDGCKVVVQIVKLHSMSKRWRVIRTKPTTKQSVNHLVILNSIKCLYCMAF